MTDKRKRAAPTIDLTATEVAPDAPPPEGAPAQEQAAPPREETAAAPETPPHDFIKTIAMPLAAGFAGAMLGGAVIWGMLPRAANNRGEMAALQKQILELKTRPAPGVDTQVLDALRQRVGKIEHDVAGLPPGDKTVADRLAAADGALKSLGIALAALNKRSDDASAEAKQAQQGAAAADKAVDELRASLQSARQQATTNPAELEAVRKQIATLEQSIKSVREQITANTTADKAARLALSAASLRDAVDRGEPYQAALAQVKALGADEHAFAPLASFAASGVPSRQALARELNDLMPAVIKAAGAQNSPAGFLERLQANASRLVRIQPVDAPAGDTPSDVLARIDVAAAHADVAAALADLAKLPEAARAPAAAWIVKAKARQDALAAARKLAADSTRVLGK